jgi:predicted secreted protein
MGHLSMSDDPILSVAFQTESMTEQSESGTAVFKAWLIENLSTGYEWVLASKLPNDVVMDKTHIAPDEEDAEICGSAGKAQFTFLYDFWTTRPTTVRLEYRRPFESTSLPPVQVAELCLITHRKPYWKGLWKALKGNT